MYFTLPALSAMNVMTWKCHVDNSTKGRYDMMLGKYVLTELGLNIKLSDNVIEADDGTFKGITIIIFDLGTYDFKKLNTEKITPEESFIDAYTEEVYESEHVCTVTKLLRVILDAK